MAWGYFKKHPLLSSIIVFLLITLPSTIDSYWDLWQKYTEANVPPLDFDFWWRVLSPIAGFIIAGIILWQLRPNKITQKNNSLVSRTTPTENKSMTSDKPIKKEPSILVHDNVLWEDEGDYWGGGGIIINGPLCPKDYAVLMMEQYDKIKELENDKLISKESFHCRLYCPECKTKYILNDPPKSANDSLAEVRNRFKGVRKRS